MIEIGLLVSLVSVAFAVFVGVVNIKRNKTLDDKGSATAIATINTKLDFIIKEVAKISAIEERLQSTNERLAKVESAVKSAHKRLDEVKL